MIDTIQLSLNDYEIRNNPQLNVIRSTIDLSTGELKGDFHLLTINGDPVYGKKAFLNDPLFSLTLRPLGDSVRCFLKFSFPKVYLGNNFHPINIPKCCGVLLNLNKRLKESGIRTNIFHSDLSRIDIFKNVETDENFSSYTNLFSLLRAKRMKARDFPTMFLWQNGRQQIVAYDKIQEFKRRHIPTTDLPKNVIRFERRLLNKTKIKKTLGFSNVEDLLENPDTVEHEF